jgi:hypothetical protein
MIYGSLTFFIYLFRVLYPEERKDSTAENAGNGIASYRFKKKLLYILLNIAVALVLTVSQSFNKNSVSIPLKR